MNFRTMKALTTAALAGNAAYTMPSVKVEMFNKIRGKVVADQAGSLAFQQSDDNVTWDTLTTTAVSANTPLKFEEQCYCNYFRAVYTNGATLQGSFRLSIYADPFS
ncbi:hypothetical protein D3C81_173980 [compost metagenome]